jgi:hypothetical protein
MKEVDFLLDVNSLGVISHKDGDALMNNIREWVLTPVGDVYGMPSWGNQFHLFRHYPANEILEMQIEAHIVTKLPVDMPSIPINGIRVIAKGVDSVTVVIGTSLGVVEEKIVKL